VLNISDTIMNRDVKRSSNIRTSEKKFELNSNSAARTSNLKIKLI